MIDLFLGGKIKWKPMSIAKKYDKECPQMHPAVGNAPLQNSVFKGHHISFSTVFTFFMLSQFKKIDFYSIQELLEISFRLNKE